MRLAEVSRELMRAAASGVVPLRLAVAYEAGDAERAWRSDVHTMYVVSLYLADRNDRWRRRHARMVRVFGKVSRAADLYAFACGLHPLRGRGKQLSDEYVLLALLRLRIPCPTLEELMGASR